MKTPREILLARHASAQPKVDAVRRRAVEQTRAQLAKAQRPGWSAVSLLVGGAGTLWRELILPSRRIWTGLAALWILIVGINVTQRDAATGAGNATGGPAMAVNWQTQQRWMNELLADRVAPPDADRPRNNSGKPRTEIVNAMAVET